jgi:serine/threonine-protein kinase HipA
MSDWGGEDVSGPFLRGVADHRTPPLIELSALLAASEHVCDEVESGADLSLLLAPGSSQGEARPKASVRDRDGQRAIVASLRPEPGFRAIQATHFVHTH